MDQRQTFDNPDELTTMLRQLQQQQLHASLLVDEEGITRVEGLITSIQTGKARNEIMVTLQHGQNILLKNIIALNGCFRSDYSEC